MSDIALYNLLKRIPNVTDDEVERAVTDVASSKDVATKSDLKTAIARVEKTIAEVKAEMLEKIGEAKNTMILWVAGVGVIILLAVLFK